MIPVRTASAVHRVSAFLHTSSDAKVEETKKKQTKHSTPKMRIRLKCRFLKTVIFDLLPPHRKQKAYHPIILDDKIFSPRKIPNERPSDGTNPVFSFHRSLHRGKPPATLTDYLSMGILMPLFWAKRIASS